MSETTTLSKALDRSELCEAIQQVFQLWRDAHDRKKQGEAGALVETKIWGQIHSVCAETFLHGTDAEIKAIADFLSLLTLRREAPRGPRPSGQEPDGCPAFEQSEASK